MSAPPRARLFVALDLPDGPRRAIARWRDRVIEGRAGLRPVRDEALHVTLVFLGHRPQAEIEPIATAMATAVSGCARARLAPAGLVPVPRRRPRLFALDLVDEGGRLGAAQAAAASALAASIGFAPERRAFWPHVTVARVRGEPLALRPGGGGAPRPAAKPPCEPFEAARLTLYRSLLHPAGARYEPLAHAELG